MESLGKQTLKLKNPWRREARAILQCKKSGFSPWVRKIPWRRKWQPTPVFLTEKSHGHRNLVGHSPRGHKERHTIELLTLSWARVLQGGEGGSEPGRL